MTAALVLPLLVACGSGEDDTAAATHEGAFGAATEEAREAAVFGAFGFGTVMAYLGAVGLEGDVGMSKGTAEPCPAYDLSDGVLTFTADGCVGPDSGATLEGTVHLTNVPLGILPFVLDLDGFGEDPDGEMAIEFLGWTTVDATGESTRYEGGFSVSNQLGAEPYDTQTDLWIELEGRPGVRRVDGYTCNDGACEATVPLEVAVDGLSSFDVDDSQMDMSGSTPSGTLVLRADDTLTVDIDSLSGLGCMDADIDGAAVRICLPELAGLSDDGGQGYVESPAFGMYAFGADETHLYVSVGTLPEYEVAAVTAELAVLSGEDTELHGMPTNGSSDHFDLWALELTEGDYVDGVSSALPLLQNYEALGAKLRAWDADGALIGCAIFGTDDDAAAQRWFGWEDCL
ncbi:hypothetical protein L6R53_03415 [Myxococcota bacterium]|nr:hypothetical protein [Myxococcota bacterium]